jgi:hypothetical protein
MNWKLLTGKQFNKKTKGKIYIRILDNNSEKCITGLNERPLRSDNFPQFGFCDINKFYSAPCGTFSDYFRYVTIPDDAIAYKSKYTLKTNKAILSEIHCFKDLNFWQNDKTILKLLKKSGLFLRFIKNQTEEMCWVAIKKTPDSIIYAKNQNDKIALFASKKFWHALPYIPFQTCEMCLEAIKLNPDSLKYVKNQTDELCLEAVKINGYALQYVKNKTPDICKAAVCQNLYSLRYADDIFKEAVKQNINVFGDDDEIKKLILSCINPIS